MPLRPPLLALGLALLAAGCVTGRLMEATASGCEKDLLDNYLKPLREGAGNVSRERRYNAAERLCRDETPDALARAKQLFDANVVGLTTDEGFERSTFQDHVKIAKFTTDAQIRCAIDETKNLPRKSGDRFEFPAKCAEVK